MKRFVKTALLFVSVTALIVFGTLVMNAYDENLSDASKLAMKAWPEKPGYPLAKLREASKNDVQDEKYRVPDLKTYQDYVKDPAAMDEALRRHASSLQALLEAYEVGGLEERNITDFRKNLAIYPFNIQPLFLMHVSQLISQGKEEEALVLLQKSNLFLKSMIQSPQLIVNMMLALANLKKNAVFAQSLKEESIAVLMSVELKESFTMNETPAEIFKNSLKREMQFVTNVMNEPVVVFLEKTNIHHNNPFQHSMLERVLSKTLYRKNQTINWYTDIHAELLSEQCQTQKDIDCSATYKKEITDAGLKFYFVNPVGRGLVLSSIPRITNLMKKVEKNVGDLQQLTSQLPPL